MVARKSSKGGFTFAQEGLDIRQIYIKIWYSGPCTALSLNYRIEYRLFCCPKLALLGKHITNFLMF